MTVKKYGWIMLAVLLVLIAAVLIVGFQVRNQQLELEKAGSVRLIVQGQEFVIPVSQLDRGEFFGETVSGKGEAISNSYRGVEVRTLLQEREYNPDRVTGMTATAADQYSAEYSGDEIREAGRVYLAVAMNDQKIEGMEPDQPGVMVIVFGDSNSKRIIRNLVKLEIR